MIGSRTVVAIVDDDARLRESLQDLLESAGYSVRSFPSAGEMLAGGLFGVDALVTDVGMPGTNGLELRDMARKALPDLPVFLITGRHELADQVRARGISGLFCKPFDGRALLAAVADALRGRQAEDGDEI